ncbi:MAG: amidohydrolase [Candidatus Bathyarchaeota archaeon]|nr:amidohydrolase [Candidatus Bathyarchaeota archaeon]
MDKAALKKKVLAEIDRKADEIIVYAETIWRYPELGFKEFKTAELTEKKYEEMGWKHEKEIAITGSKAHLKGDRTGPTVGIVGELDALHIPVHPEAHPVSGNVHACGHHSQMAATLGACMGLEVVKEHLAGDVVMVSVPAEEYIEIDYRNRLREEGKLEFFGGKQEFIRLGAMKDIDICIGSHSAMDQEELVGVGGSNNGFIGKLVHYIGKEAHAGGSPHKGINALNAAMVGLMGIHANRETFRDEDHIRVHPIITKGGEIVNNVPADVRMESYVRGKTVEAIQEANKKVNRALRAGAMAVGAEVEIHDHPGYMPYTRNENLEKVLIGACTEYVGEKEIKHRGHSTGSTDMGDFSCIMPTTSIGMSGTEGAGHSRYFKITDPVKQYIVPAKAIAVTVVDLLYGDAKPAKEIIESFKPTIKRDEYTEFMHKLVE